MSPKSIPPLIPQAKPHIKRMAPSAASHLNTYLYGAALGLGICVVFLLWLRGPQLMGWFGNVPGFRAALSNQMFIGSAEMSHDLARTQYRAGLDALKNQQNQEALAGFDKLQKYYPGLEEFVLLHKAEAYANLGQEANAQSTLKTLLDRYPDSPLRYRAQYALGQSHIRANEPDQAQTIFSSLSHQVPDHEYGIGSLYYLGLLTKTSAPATTIQYWSQYLRQCRDCVFSGDIAETLDGLLKTPTAEQHGLIGQALINSNRQPDKALVHLKQAPFNQAWFELGKAYQQNKQPELAEQAWTKGLPGSTDSQQVQDTVDALLKNSKQPRIKLLQQLSSLPIKVNGDYILWQLSLTDPGKAPTYYQTIVTRFPEGDYAPESSWNLLWPLLVSHQDSTFLSQAKTHITRYPYARSAAKALFWMGKTQEKTAGQAPAAIETYRELVKSYPESYYTFRANGRLKALADHGTDPGWSINRQNAAYPGTFALEKLHLLPSEPEFLRLYQAHLQSSLGAQRAYRAAGELQAIGAADDLQLLIQESIKDIPPRIQSWIYYQNKERPKAIRTIRDALLAQGKGQPKVLTIPTDDELKLLYPIFFQDAIAEQAHRQNLDPYLIQALIREESYFNEFAISSSNARGLMQLLPTTASEIAQWEGMSGFNTLALFQPPVNIRLGSRYLNYLHRQFDSQPTPLVSMASVGAYNGGPNAMKRWISQSPNFQKDPDWFVESIPYGQSRDYIKKVFGSYWNYKRLYSSADRP